MRKNAVTYMMLRAAALVMALVLLVSMPASADKPDADRAVTLNAVFEYGGKLQKGVEFSLYKVADMTENGSYAPCGAFSEYPVGSVNGLDSEGWRKMALTLAGYAALNGPAAVAGAVTDANGSASFGRDEKLDQGLYLLIGGMGEGCAAQPVLVSLPGIDGNGKWIYDVTVNVKGESVGNETTGIGVIKIWDDAGYDMRPESVEMVLLGNGRTVDTVTLNSANSWRHSWTGLDGSVIWYVVESPVPQGYSVMGDRDGALVTYTNRLIEEGGGGEGGEGSLDGPGATAGPDATLGPGGTYGPDGPGVTAEPDTPGETYRPGGDGYDDEPGGDGDIRLPQTGLLWWPVPVLAAAGMALFAIGWLYRRKDEE